MYRRIIFTLMILFSAAALGYTQSIETIYFLPGQGSDKRIFDSIRLNSNYTLKYLEYDSLVTKTSLKELARRISTQIDTSEEFALVGVSLGGMICVELAELLHPSKVIIISSAENRNELPFRYRFQKTIPLFEIFPARVIYWGAKILQPWVEPDRNRNKETFKKMLYRKNPKYLKRTIRMIVRWERKSTDIDIIHIHGTKDHTIPLRNVKKPDYIIENGSHMMALTRAKEISEILNKELGNP